MVLRLKRRAYRAGVLVAATVGGTALSFFGIRNALAVHASGLGTRAGFERAVHLEPQNARNWYLLGRYWQYNIENPDLQRAIANYRRALSLEPNSADTWLDLASAYDGEGLTDHARQAFLSAKNAYPSSADVAWRYGNFLLREDWLEPAFSEIHRAVTEDPRLAAEAFSRCWRAKPDPEAILDQVIPPSEGAYVSILRDLSASRQIDAALTVWKRLAALHTPVSPREIGPFTNLLLQSGRFPDMQSVWQQAVAMMPDPPPADPPGSVLWDGGFESSVAGDGLAWQYPEERRGVVATLDRSQRHSGRQSLRLVFSGKDNSAYAEACHYVLVDPGVSYRLSGWILVKEFETSEGIRLRLSVPGNAGAASAETPDVRGTEPWTRLSLLWTAPRDARLASVCVVRLAGSSFEENVQGSAWIDDVSLVPVFPEPAKP